jgi:SAM-dependent methyltransferase
MEILERALEESFNINFIDMTISNPRRKQGMTKVKIKPVLIKGRLFFQFASYTENKVYHSNYEGKKAEEFCLKLMKDQFKQAEWRTKSEAYTALISKKGKVTVKKKAVMNEKEADLSHNRKKKYLLEEGKPVNFLVDLGVMTREGKIVSAKYDKFRQINRFLEFIEDVLPALPEDGELTIIDFGCGKSYLTFAMYYYLKELMKYKIQVVGLDLKEDVITCCNELKDRYGFDGLHFYKGDIASFEGVKKADMVVTLHACDTATDYALEKAVKWGAKVILSVPCCQHEVNRQIESEILSPLLEYGLIKERMAALVTDAYRAKMLEICGYKTQILEFIDMEHTPKNILIRAVKGKKADKEEREKLEVCSDFLHIHPTLKELLEDWDGGQ